MYITQTCMICFLALSWVWAQAIVTTELLDGSIQNDAATRSTPEYPTIKSDCPLSCSCMDRQSSLSGLVLYTVDCTAAGLKYVPDHLSPMTDALILKSNHIRAEHVGNLERLTNLTELDLSTNSMYSVESLQLDLAGLLYLLLDHNDIDYLPNRSFMSSPNLIFLSIVGNKIEIMHANAFEGLNNLQTLHLSDNRIFEIDTKWFRKLTSLRVLHLQDNNIHIIQSSNFKYLRSLKTLNLSKNHLKHIYPDAFHGLDYLNELILRENHLGNFPGREFQHFHLISLIDLSANSIPWLESGAVQNINVTTLQLTRMPNLLLIDREAFLDLPYLAVLDLSNNRHLMYLDRHALQKLPILHTLYLHNANLSSLAESVVDSLPSLTHLSFYSNAPHCDCNLNWLIHEMVEHSRNVTFLKPTDFSCVSPPSLKGVTLTDDRLMHLPQVCPPRILPLFSQEYNTALGETVRFDCRATGIPPPQTDWLLPSHHPNEDVVLLKAGSHSQDNIHIQVTPAGTLYIDYVQGTDQGQYTCLASNPHGRDERTAHVHVKNMQANVIIMRITATAITVTWKSTRYAHDYQILYRPSASNISYDVIDIKPYMRSYTASELTAQTRYEFCIAVHHNGRSVRINCTHVTTRDNDYIHLGMFDSRNYVIGGSIASFLVIGLLVCILTHVIRKFNKRRRQQEELYSDNLSQLFLASIDSMSDTTPITYENRGAEMFDDDDIEEIRSTASMGSATSSIR